MKKPGALITMRGLSKEFGSRDPRTYERDCLRAGIVTRQAGNATVIEEDDLPKLRRYYQAQVAKSA